MLRINCCNKDDILRLKAGQYVSLSGTIYTARDRAHQRLSDALAEGKPLPFDIKGKVIYYCGPTQTPAGMAIGSCGPTTSRRMDAFTPGVLKAGLMATIGKGGRSPEVAAAVKRYKSIYFVTYAGCGAYLAGCVKSCKVKAYADLGPEAVYELQVEDFPLIVAIDTKGNDIYAAPGAKYELRQCCVSTQR